MAAGTYICPELVERDGYLVAFAGERMTMDEAARRGLATAEPEPPAPKRRTRKASK